MAFSDSLDREAAWLNTVIDDGLPILPFEAGGPFQVIQARWNRTFATRKTTLVVLRQPLDSYRHDPYTSQRVRTTTRIQLRAWWAASNGTGSAEKDQLAFEQALDLVIARVAGPFGDKTHGGRFLSVAENPALISVTFDDPELSLQNGSFYRAQISYSADDPEIVN